MRLGALIRLGRPQFLVGGFVMFALGAAVAARCGHAIDVTRYALGQLAVTAFQLMTHYANDYFDYDCDVANRTPTRWSGGSRVLTAGELPRGIALDAAVVLALVGIVATLVLATVGAGAWTVPTLLAIAVLAWEYSAPPWRLCAAGLGELTTAVVVTGLVPWLAFYLQAPDLAGAGTLVRAIVPLALLQFAMLVAIELPDAAGDRATGKRTLVVRFGGAAAARLYATATLAAYLWIAVAGLPVAALLPLPIAIWRAARVSDGNHARTAFFAVLLVVVTAVAELAGLLA